MKLTSPSIHPWIRNVYDQRNFPNSLFCHLSNNTHGNKAMQGLKEHHELFRTVT